MTCASAYEGSISRWAGVTGQQGVCDQAGVQDMHGGAPGLHSFLVVVILA